MDTKREQHQVAKGSSHQAGDWSEAKKSWMKCQKAAIKMSSPCVLLAYWAGQSLQRIPTFIPWHLGGSKKYQIVCVQYQFGTEGFYYLRSSFQFGFYQMLFYGRV